MACLGCRRGEDMYCENDAFPGLTTDGGFAHYLHVGGEETRIVARA